MSIKFDSGLEKTFREVSLNMRQWATWKLQTGNNAWDTMSKADQEYNVMFNQLVAACRHLTAEELHKVVNFALNVK